jgi:hypothetical protein
MSYLVSFRHLFLSSEGQTDEPTLFFMQQIEMPPNLHAFIELSRTFASQRFDLLPFSNLYKVSSFLMFPVFPIAIPQLQISFIKTDTYFVVFRYQF